MRAKLRLETTNTVPPAVPVIVSIPVSILYAIQVPYECFVYILIFASFEMSSAVVKELEPTVVAQGDEKYVIKTFSLGLNGVTIELCELGASITRLLVPSALGTHDIVLGYQSVEDMFNSKNPPYFGVTVGRVANRINKGRFQLHPDGQVYKLETNFGQHALHGGPAGFSNCIWEGTIKDYNAESGDKCVCFTLKSADGDQGYPGSVVVSATYRLRPTSNGVKLCLVLGGTLQGDKPSPINLAQHTYFNLSRHDDPDGILDHMLTLHCDAYTPVDSTTIPTREVRSLDEDSTMDWRKGRLLREALVNYGAAKAGLSRQQSEANVRKRHVSPDLALSSSESEPPNGPYGYDHNYIVQESTAGADSLTVVGKLEHESSGRRLTVKTDAPGVQLYTGNYLDGKVPAPSICKDGATYRQWQGVCLETQHFPDSINIDEVVHPQFAKGQCIMLRPEQPHYKHEIEYELEYEQAAEP